GLDALVSRVGRCPAVPFVCEARFLDHVPIRLDGRGSPPVDGRRRPDSGPIGRRAGVPGWLRAHRPLLAVSPVPSPPAGSRCPEQPAGTAAPAPPPRRPRPGP